MSSPIKLSDFTIMSAEQREMASQHRSGTSEAHKVIYQTRFDMETGYFHLELKFVERNGTSSAPEVADEPVNDDGATTASVMSEPDAEVSESSQDYIVPANTPIPKADPEMEADVEPVTIGETAMKSESEGKLSDLTIMSAEQQEMALQHRPGTSEVDKVVYQTRSDIETGYFHLELKFDERRGTSRAPEVASEPINDDGATTASVMSEPDAEVSESSQDYIAPANTPIPKADQEMEADVEPVTIGETAMKSESEGQSPTVDASEISTELRAPEVAGDTGVSNAGAAPVVLETDDSGILKPSAGVKIPADERTANEPHEDMDAAGVEPAAVIVNKHSECRRKSLWSQTKKFLRRLCCCCV